MVKRIGGVIIIFIAVAISISGLVSLFENVAEFNITKFIAAILTIAIGIFLGNFGLKLFRRKN